MKQGIKNDFKDNKLRWDLLPLEELEDIVKVYTEGAKKYADNSWQLLTDGYARYKAALFRHLVLFEKGEEMDNETGCRHLAQVAWNAIAMLYHSKHKKETQKDLLDKLDERISEKIESCNSILDMIDITELSSDIEKNRRKEIEKRQEERKKEVQDMLDDIEFKLHKDTKGQYHLETSIIGNTSDLNKDNIYYDISSLGEVRRDVFGIDIGKNTLPVVHVTGSTDLYTLDILVNELIKRYKYEHNEGKSGTGNGDLSKNDREVSNGSRICKS